MPLVCVCLAVCREINLLSHCRWGHMGSSGSGQAYGLHPPGVTLKAVE